LLYLQHERAVRVSGRALAGEDIMRQMLFASAALLGLAFGLPALAQTPQSTNASNISPADTHSLIAPQLPVPAVGENASPHELLAYAQQALKQHHTGAAQEALERAETRLLDRTTAPAAGNTPDVTPLVEQINQARQALGRNDIDGASQIIASALSASGG
jgi:hypothetical protein